MKTRECKGCFGVFPAEAMSINGRGNPRPWCKPCYNSRAQSLRAANVERYRDYDRAHRAKDPEFARRANLKKYGLTVAEYDALVDAQGGRCAVCGFVPEGQSLCVDHDHACCTGIRSCGNCIRGLLCRLCNLAAGNLRDDPARALALALYLEVHN